MVTDASFDHETKAAGWAAWAVHDGGRKFGSGNFKIEPASANEAELLAAANGIAIATTLASEFHTVHLVTDSLYVIGRLTSKKKKLKLSSFDKMVKNKVFNLLKPHGAQLIARHVKGHSKVNDKRSYVNRWCDRRAKQAMRKQQEARR